MVDFAEIKCPLEATDWQTAMFSFWNSQMSRCEGLPTVNPLPGVFDGPGAYASCVASAAICTHFLKNVLHMPKGVERNQLDIVCNGMLLTIANLLLKRCPEP